MSFLEAHCDALQVNAVHSKLNIDRLCFMRVRSKMRAILAAA
jgi:hypothetical protein